MTFRAPSLDFIPDASAPVCTEEGCMLPAPAPVNPLFTPATVAGLELNNRFALAPMGLQRSPGGVPGPDMAEYYARRSADGGAGLIITETTAIDHVSVGAHLPNLPRLRPGASERGHARLAESVHDVGGKILLQLFHPGATSMGPPDPDHMRSPSGFYWRPGMRRGGTLTREEIDEIIEAYADAAALAEATGFDGVEVHGAHGYLVDEFLWAATNRRDDEYGGSARRRSRFAVEVVSRIRQRTSQGFQIGFRLSQWKSGVPGSRLVGSPEELRDLVEPIADAGVDLFHVSVRSFDEPAFPGSDLSLAGWVKRFSRKPSITVGGIGMRPEGGPDARYDFSPLTRRYESGEFDAAAVGRALLLSPKWLARQTSRLAAG